MDQSNPIMGQQVPGTRFPADTPDLAALYGLQSPGPFQQPTVGLGQRANLPQGANLSGLMMNPYGITPPQGLGKYSGKGPNIFGGPQDLMKSLATSAMGVNLIGQQYGQPSEPQGLSQALSGYAASNPYLASMTQNYLPQLQGQGLQQQQGYQGQLRDLIANAYIQQGALYGGQLQGVAAAKQIAKAKEAQKKAFLSAVIGGAASGLTGNQYGEGDTSSGLGGAIG